MDLRRVAGVAGLVAATLLALLVILTFAAGMPPALDDPARDVANYYQDNRATLQLTGILGLLVLFVLPLWFIPLYRWLRDRAWAAGDTTGTARVATDDSGGWATIALAGFIATGAVNAAQTGVATALASGVEDELSDGPVVTALFDIYNGMGAGIGPLFALFLLGLAYAARGTGYLPSWATPVLLVAAAASLLSIFGPITESDFFAILALISLILFIAVLTVSSMRMTGTTAATRRTAQTEELPRR